MMLRWKALCWRAKSLIANCSLRTLRWPGQHLFRDLARPVDLDQEFVERRNIVVALDHGRDPTEALQGRDVEIPYVFADGMIMGVDDVSAHMAVSGHVELDNTVSRNSLEEIERIVTVIEGTD